MKQEYLNKLREISESFQQGTASHENIKQLNDILTMINHGQRSNNIFDDVEKSKHKDVN